ncbi:hypothetical protein BGZ94_008527, partial [Podila epigama]
AQKQAGPGENGEGLDGEGYDGEDGFRHPAEGRGDGIQEEDDLVEGIVIIGLCLAVGYLMYIRQFRFANNNNNNNANGNNNGNNNNNNDNAVPRGNAPQEDPHNPGRFAYYAAGG